MLPNTSLAGAAWSVPSGAALLVHAAAPDANGPAYPGLALDDRIVAWAARYRVIVGWRAGSDDVRAVDALQLA